MAVRCQCRVGFIGKSVQSLIIGLIYRHINIKSYQVYRCINIRLIGLYLQALRILLRILRILRMLLILRVLQIGYCEYYGRNRQTRIRCYWVSCNSNIGISLSRLAELLIALIAIYKISSLLASSSSKEIILYTWRNSVYYRSTFLILLYTLIGTSLTLIAIIFTYY